MPSLLTLSGPQLRAPSLLGFGDSSCGTLCSSQLAIDGNTANYNTCLDACPLTWATIPTWVKVIDVASIVASGYHGYKRNSGSVGWTVAWLAFGAIAPVLAPIVALSQGFAKPAERYVYVQPLRGTRHRRRRLGDAKREPPPVYFERKGPPPGVPVLRGARKRKRR